MKASLLWLAARSLLWTLLLPGLFAGFLPWRYFGLSQVVIDARSPRQLLGLAAIGIGVVLLGTVSGSSLAAAGAPSHRSIHPRSWWSRVSTGTSGIPCTSVLR